MFLVPDQVVQKAIYKWVPGYYTGLQQFNF